MVYSAEVSGMIGQLGEKNIMKYSLHFITKILHREYEIGNVVNAIYMS